MRNDQRASAGFDVIATTILSVPPAVEASDETTITERRLFRPGLSSRAQRAVDEFHAAHPTAAEAVFVTAASFEAGVPELSGPEFEG